MDHWTYLVTFTNHVDHLIVTDEIHIAHLLHRFNGFDADKSLTQRYGTETLIEVKQTFVGIHSQKPRDVYVIWQCCGESNDSNHTLRRLYLQSKLKKYI